MASTTLLGRNAPKFTHGAHRTSGGLPRLEQNWSRVVAERATRSTVNEINELKELRRRCTLSTERLNVESPGVARRSLGMFSIGTADDNDGIDSDISSSELRGWILAYDGELLPCTLNGSLGAAGCGEGNVSTNLRTAVLLSPADAMYSPCNLLGPRCDHNGR